MKKTPLATLDVLDRLEKFYGRQEPNWPVDPYEFIVWWHCGYPASDVACAKGWEKLTREVGSEPHQILEASSAKLASALKPGGMVPELRALRLKEIAMRVKNNFGGDLRSALTGPITDARKKLKKFPSIAEPGADRILLFGDMSPIAAVPSNCPHGPHPRRPRTGELHRELSCGTASNCRRGTREIRCSEAGLLTPETSWPGNLQTYQTEV
jgi:endonuclease III